MAKTTVTDPKLAWGKTSLVESGQTGKALKTTRVVKKSGAVIHNTIWTSVWPMYPEIRAVPSSTTTTLPPETTTTTAPPGP
jgi:uncharacterized protein YabE (DUF348 family)